MYTRLLNLPVNDRDSLFLLGPRVTGKTAWLTSHIKDSIYLDLLDFNTYGPLLADPSRLAVAIPKDYQGWVIIDEVQRSNPDSYPQFTRMLTLPDI